MRDRRRLWSTGDDQDGAGRNRGITLVMTGFMMGLSVVPLRVGSQRQERGVSMLRAMLLYRLCFRLLSRNNGFAS